MLLLLSVMCLNIMFLFDFTFTFQRLTKRRRKPLQKIQLQKQNVPRLIRLRWLNK